jgi:hypothetical protein
MPELQQEVHKLPSCLSTLKRQTTSELPLLPMRKKSSIPLQPDQLAKEKPPTTLSSSSTVPSEDLFFFDPTPLFTAFLRSKISEQMHFGFGEFHDNPQELWHSHAWRSSIRTTSGQFAHYSSRQPIFPSDFVFFRCHQVGQRAPCIRQRNSHQGRVTVSICGSCPWARVSSPPSRKTVSTRFCVSHRYLRNNVTFSPHVFFGNNVLSFTRCEIELKLSHVC